MRTFSIYTLGCKVNRYESAQIRQFLEKLGLSAVKPTEKPDLFVINTCCVTATASAKSRQYIQRAKKLNERAVKVICGCLAALGTNELRSIENKSTFLVAGREELAGKLFHIIGGARSGYPPTNSTNTYDIAQYPSIKPKNEREINTFADLTSLPKLPLLTEFKEQTRAFLKVQDGCDGVCSYCIIPKTRPVVQSKPIEEAVAEAKALVSAGHKEIVVTGVNLGAYGLKSVRKTGDRRQKSGDRRQKTEKRSQNIEDRTQNIERPTSNGEALSVLLEQLAQVEGLARLRVSSLEPGDISEQLLDVFCKNRNIMPHIHLSVQSGADNILRRMCRQYWADELREKITLIKSRLDRPAITCDLIVGFPGETEEDFQATVELAKWAGFSKMHIFPFSARAGTAAAKMKDRVQPKVVKERAEVLRKLGDCLGRKFREQFVGKSCEVLLENTNPISGRCERYFVIYLDPLLLKQGYGSPTAGPTKLESRTGGAGGQIRKKNEIIKVKITGVSSEGAIGEIKK